MKRVRAHALAMVNWKGVFYERYLLDPNVTALEGANGSGKTTVLIAAYMVLLPDLSKLRFTNLGESAATGGDRGIYGRLGEPGRPTYAVLDIRLPRGERLLAGVHLERRSEPNVELTPFLVSGLAADVMLQDILLDRGEMDEVPELPRLRQLAAFSSGRLETFDTLKDYFAALFDRGVTPMRLAADDERVKFNDMLRTSMVGGISKALSDGLRGFLLKEETGLADTLKRMRGNLDACRRTRHQVEEANSLEREIHGVYEAGQTMFAAALHATRERERESREKRDLARAAWQETQRELDEEEARLADVRHHQEAAQAVLVEASQALEEARQDLERTRRAHEIQERILGLEGEHEGLLPRHASLEQAVVHARERQARALEELDAARDRHETAARGIAEWRTGLETLEQQAFIHEQVVKRLASAQAAEAAGHSRLPASPLAAGQPALSVSAGSEPPVGLAWDAQGVAERTERARHLRSGCDKALVRLSREVETAEQRRREFAQAMEAVALITGEACEPVHALARARAALSEVRDLEVQAAREHELQALARAAAQQAQTQAAIRVAAAALGLHTQADVQEAFAGAGTELATLQEARRQCDRAELEAREQGTHAASRLRQLEETARLRREVATMLGQLAQRHERSLEGRADLLALQEALLTQRLDLDSQKRQAEELRDALAEEARRLEQSGGTFPDTLLDARDLVEGELFAGRFEDVSLEEAAQVQALLGPLAEAIVVEDARDAARLLAESDGVPETVWLLEVQEGLATGPDGIPGCGAGEVVGRHALVAAPPAHRLTRFPSRPTLGRKARAQQMAQVQGEEARQSEKVVELSSSIRAVQASQAEVTRLLPEVAILEQPDPAAEMERLTAERSRTLETLERARAQAGDLRLRIASETRRQADLGRLLTQAHLLDLPDQAAEAQRLGGLLEAARQARTRLASIAKAVARLQESLDVLRQPPPDPLSVARMREEQGATELLRDRLEILGRDLGFVQAHFHALADTGARKALTEQKSLAPALEEQLVRAREHETNCLMALRRLEEALAAAVASLQREEGRLRALEAALERERAALQETGCSDPSDQGLQEAQHRHHDAVQAQNHAAADERRWSQDCVRLEERTRHIRETSRQRQAEAEAAEGTWRPDHERWERLHAQSEKAGMLAAALGERFVAQFAHQGNVALWTHASTWRSILLERLGPSRDGNEVATEIRGLLGADSEQQRGELYLECWILLQDWVRRRVPANIAQADDPLERLEQLRSHLARLQDNLCEQERRLRGQSSDVAHHIDTQVRKARSTVSRLNQELSRVRFGSIHAVRISALPVERMQQALRALREGAAQQLLFEAEMPIEEAMAELFRRYGGGRDGGDRLLDYREYLKLQVEVRRGAARSGLHQHRRQRVTLRHGHGGRPESTGNETEPDGPAEGHGAGRETSTAHLDHAGEWEDANPVRMSTGEAMGVGAAVMMVVLAAWERDARLFRGATQAGTLRLLFLDEATRLSQDNLAMLFELCRNLELQLLIAAPEVARGEGTTTYRLVRHIDAQGREEVLVAGRRFVMEAGGAREINSVRGRAVEEGGHPPPRAGGPPMHGGA